MWLYWLLDRTVQVLVLNIISTSLVACLPSTPGTGRKTQRTERTYLLRTALLEIRNSELCLAHSPLFTCSDVLLTVPSTSSERSEMYCWRVTELCLGKYHLNIFHLFNYEPSQIPREFEPIDTFCGFFIFPPYSS